MVSKFPVVGQYGEYKVDIELRYQDDYGFGEIPFWEVTIKEPIQPKKFFKFEDKIVYTYHPSNETYNSNNYIQMAKIAVLEYERTVKLNKDKEEAKKVFEQWDGKVF